MTMTMMMMVIVMMMMMLLLMMMMMMMRLLTTMMINQQCHPPPPQRRLDGHGMEGGGRGIGVSPVYCGQSWFYTQWTAMSSHIYTV